ncbi:glycoside hydrolase family 99-like domain-containing protein [Thauera mechernichensis]|uniref:Glycoside hydrolase family 99-like domain-containing protein n=1 Tax=Thauera mechernichensis TaxID=82788 RepID=A0ABW3WDV2_9RHOO|nr:glycoside hydrolase family 99-like domain-containing protein [Thauera mechernichensis]MDG3065883.1 glycoside hydrolase family 99-like domain-containing protein [Thauera mechernichensis]
MKVNTIAFYLPQFHPIEENNAWWGDGFTEWTNVSQARPRFKGHHQPQIPADLGFYDLRLHETRISQAALARNFGIYGFCYYHYWFNGRMLLDRPFNEVLASGEPDFPFCLCWANENWTRAWDGLDRQVLIKQDYTEEDSDSHIQWLIEAFRDDRYIKIDGRPLLLIYRLDHIPEIGKMINSWRNAVREEGFPGLYLCAVKNGFVEISDENILKIGFDAIVDFQPDRRDFPAPQGPKQAFYRLARRILPGDLYQRIKLSASANNIVNYRSMVEGMIHKIWPTSYRKFPCVFPSWDNSARRKSATIIQNDDPVMYGKWLKHAIESVRSYPDSEKFVFINAWNEWAEGCHLEPDRKHGHAFLEQTRDVLRSTCATE